MALGAAFLALCADPWAEALRVRVYVRLNDSGGSPGTLVHLTATQEVLALNPLLRKREREFGVVQGQVWQVQLTNRDLGLLGYDLKDCWCCLRGGFAAADEWETFSQGKIKKVTWSSGGTVTLEVQDSVMDVLNYVLPRDIRFQDAGWISEVQIMSKASGSATWNSGVPLVLGAPANATDETYIIEFTTPTSYKVILEDGDDTQTSSIASSKNVDNVGGDTVFTIPSSGWSTASGAYATGDRFVIYTARERTADQLTAVYMVAHLLDDVLGMQVYDVMAAANYGSPRLNTSHWTTAAEAAVDAQHVVQGYFPKGTQLIRLIQDALKLVHGSIYPTPTGQIGLWVLAPSTSIAATLNGVPGRGVISILDDMTVTDNIDDAISRVSFTYKTLDGEDASCESIDGDSDLLEVRSAEFDISWEARGPSVQDACDKYLNRYRAGFREFTIPTTLAGLAADLADGIAFAESELGMDGELSDVTEIELDLIENSVVLRAHTDPVVVATYFRLNSSLLNGAEVLW